jgi:hypothetical protein
MKYRLGREQSAYGPYVTVWERRSRWTVTLLLLLSALMIRPAVAQTIGSAGGITTPRVPTIDINNNVTLRAQDAAGDGNLINLIGSDAKNQVHVGGGAARAVSLDNSMAVNQGVFSSGAYVDVPATNSSFTGGVENCMQKWHIYTLAANSTITLACSNTGTVSQTLEYLFYQPATGSTYTYTFTAGNGATLLGDTPTACASNGCVDQVEVTWVAPQNNYIINLKKANIGGVATCPAGQTCYYVSASTGADTNAGTSPSAPWASLSKANSVLSTLNPGDEILFKAGDTWTASSSNVEFKFGDTTAHAATGSASKPIIISTYGTARAVFDMGNVNSACFSARQAPYAFKYVTLSNIECRHAFAQGVSFITSGGKYPGITVQNFYIHNVGPGCSTSNTACVGNANEIPPDWAASTAYTSTGANNLIYPLTNNAGGYWFIETVSSCTSGTTYPTFPQTAGGTVTDGTCTWQNTGLQYGYKNALDFEDTGVAADGVHFLNNIVQWMGGHNCVEVHYDTGAVLVQGNVVGPGCVHGGIDVKGVGNAAASPPVLAQILSNTSTCGYSRTLCGCQQSGGNCSSNMTPAFYTHNEVTTASENVIYQENVAYDSGIGFQMYANAGVSPASSTRCYNSTSNVCPIQAKFYNNDAYLPTGISNSYGILVGCGGNGPAAPCTASSIDTRNNIFDGAGSYSVNVVSGYGTEKEDYNDIGGAQGSPGFTFNGSTTRGLHDLYCSPVGSCSGSSAYPKYVNAAAYPPNLNLQSGSPCLGTGLTGLTTGNNDIGAF